eukprot:6214348-Pleurochrysis_carterae.AAC.1
MSVSDAPTCFLVNGRAVWYDHLLEGECRGCAPKVPRGAALVSRRADICPGRTCCAAERRIQFPVLGKSWRDGSA